MEVHQRRPLQQWNLETHETWLAAQARNGLHLRGFSALRGFRFERGEPGNFAFRWDRSPRDKQEFAIYVNRRVAAGWAPVADTGRLVCWRRAQSAEAPVVPLRDAGETRTMYREMVKEYLCWGAVILLPLSGAGGRLLGGKSSLPLLDIGLVVACSLYFAGAAYAIMRIKGHAGS